MVTGLGLRDRLRDDDISEDSRSSNSSAMMDARRGVQSRVFFPEVSSIAKPWSRIT